MIENNSPVVSAIPQTEQQAPLPVKTVKTTNGWKIAAIVFGVLFVITLAGIIFLVVYDLTQSPYFTDNVIYSSKVTVTEQPVSNDNDTIPSITPTSGSNTSHNNTPTAVSSGNYSSDEEACQAKESKLKGLVDVFEGFQQARNADSVLKMFVDPPYDTAKDNEDYNYLSGKDSNSAPRLYSNNATNYDVLSYRVTGHPSSFDDAEHSVPLYCYFNIEETRQYTVQGQKESPETGTYILQFVSSQVGTTNTYDHWLINGYFLNYTSGYEPRFEGFDKGLALNN